MSSTAQRFSQKHNGYRPKYDDLLSNPTSDAQAAGHTRASAAYKQKAGPADNAHCQMM